MIPIYFKIPSMIIWEGLDFCYFKKTLPQITTGTLQDPKSTKKLLTAQWKRITALASAWAQPWIGQYENAFCIHEPLFPTRISEHTSPTTKTDFCMGPSLYEL